MNVRGTLNEAFDELEERYLIVTDRGEFCCSSCGHHMMRRAYKEANPGEGPPPLGYVFWNAQSDETLTERGDVWLQFGAFADEDSAVRIAGDVVAVLEAKGLRVEWEGTVDRAIHVLAAVDA